MADQCALDSDGLDHLAGAIAHVSCCASKVAFRALSADLPYAPDTSEIAAEVASIAAEAYVSAGRAAAGAGGGEWLATTMLAASRDIQTLHGAPVGESRQAWPGDRPLGGRTTRPALAMREALVHPRVLPRHLSHCKR